MPEHFRVLMDLDAAAVGAAAVAPGDGIVARNRTGRVIQRAEDRRVPPQVRSIIGTDALHSLRADHFAVHPEVLVHFGPPAHGAHRGVGVGQREMAARRVEQVQVEVLRQVLPQPHALVVELHAFGRQIVGADDGRIAAGIAAADVALLEHRDVGDAVIAGQIVGGRQSVTAGRR